MRDLVEAMACALVDHPEEVQVRERRLREGGVRIEVSVAPSDRGQVIGRRGTTIGAIRTLVHHAAEIQGISATVEVEG